MPSQVSRCAQSKWKRKSRIKTSLLWFCFGLFSLFFWGGGALILLASPATLSDPRLRAVSQHKTNGTNAFQTPVLTSNRRAAASLVVLTCSGRHASLHNNGVGRLPSVRESRSSSLVVKSCRPECEAAGRDSSVAPPASPLRPTGAIRWSVISRSEPPAGRGGEKHAGSWWWDHGGVTTMWSPKPGASRVAPCFTAFSVSNFALKKLKNQNDKRFSQLFAP